MQNIKRSIPRVTTYVVGDSAEGDPEMHNYMTVMLCTDASPSNPVGGRRIVISGRFLTHKPLLFFHSSKIHVCPISLPVLVIRHVDDYGVNAGIDTVKGLHQDNRSERSATKDIAIYGQCIFISHTII